MSENSEATLKDLLAECTVPLEVGGKHEGTGFFVGPGLVLTCYHVVAPSTSEVRVVQGEAKTQARIGSSWPEEDLALLEVPGLKDSPCVLLGDFSDPGKDNYSFGYPKASGERASGERAIEGNPVTLEYEGPTGGDRSRWKFKEGQVPHGMSGSAVLSFRFGAVGSVIRETRDQRSDLGGYSIPIQVLKRLAPKVLEDNYAYHRDEDRWTACLSKNQRTLMQPLLGDQPPPPTAVRTMLVTVGPRGATWNVSARLVGGDGGDLVGPVSLDLNPVRVQVARLFRDWALRGRVADSDKVRLLGGILYKAVFRDEIDRKFLDHLPVGQQRLLVSLRFEEGTDEELIHLPWEYLFHPNREPDLFFASDNKIAFSRCLVEESEPLEPRSRIRVLVVRVLPRDALGRNAVREICEKLLSLKKDLGNIEFEEVSGVDATNPSGLEETLGAREFDVVHYVGSGRLVGEKDELLLGHEYGEGEVDYFDVSFLAQALGAARALRLVILQNCEGPRDAVPADFGKLGPTLLKLNLEGVLAFKDPLEWELAWRFNEDLYSAIEKGDSLQIAVQDSRRKLISRSPGKTAFVSPALFTKGPAEVRLLEVGAAPGVGERPRRRVGIG